jgi:hypothetical protein
MMLGLSAVGWTLMGWLKKDSPIHTRQHVLILAAIGTMCGLSVLVNPFGLDLVRTWFKVLGSSAMKEVVSEHMPLSLRHTAGQVVVLFAGVYALVMIGVPRSQWRIVHAVPWVWFILTLTGIRNGPLFAVSAAVAMADLWPHSRYHAYLLLHGDSTADTPHLRPIGLWLLASLGCVGASFGLIAGGIRVPLVGAEWARFEPMTVPVDINDAVAEIPAGDKIFNEANWGGYLIYFAPGRKIFMDDRFELCGDDWLRHYANGIDLAPATFDEWQAKYGFRWALISIGENDPTPLEHHVATKSGFELVKRGAAVALYKKKGHNAPTRKD